MRDERKEDMNIDTFLIDDITAVRFAYDELMTRFRDAHYFITISLFRYRENAIGFGMIRVWFMAR